MRAKLYYKETKQYKKLKLNNLWGDSILIECDSNDTLKLILDDYKRYKFRKFFAISPSSENMKLPFVYSIVTSYGTEERTEIYTDMFDFNSLARMNLKYFIDVNGDIHPMSDEILEELNIRYPKIEKVKNDLNCEGQEVFNEQQEGC